MDILFLLIPLSVILALAILAALAWAVWRGQFESLWLASSGGTVYLIYPNEQVPPPDGANGAW